MTTHPRLTHIDRAGKPRHRADVERHIRRRYSGDIRPIDMSDKASVLLTVTPRIKPNTVICAPFAWRPSWGLRLGARLARSRRCCLVFSAQSRGYWIRRSSRSITRSAIAVKGDSYMVGEVAGRIAAENERISVRELNKQLREEGVCW